jgi:hypothetical protein
MDIKNKNKIDEDEMSGHVVHMKDMINTLNW